jgi:lysophospholipase L1-like esterase
MMQSILAFGDSLTWGYVPGGAGRHDFDTRWPNVLAAGLGSARVIEEGLNGRMTVHQDPIVEEQRSGSAVLPMLLASHAPLHLVIIMLGSNDLKFERRCTARDASYGVKRLVEITQRFGYPPGCSTPDILVVSPPALVATPDDEFDDLFGHAIAESHRFAEHYSALGVNHFNAATVCAASDIDGVHLDAANTAALGRALVPVVREILERGKAAR